MANNGTPKATRHGEFLLERALFNKHKVDSSGLIAAARSLLTLVLKAHGLRQSCYEYQVDIVDVVGDYMNCWRCADRS